MAKPKIDGIVEAVRYTPDGEIAWVRAYERRGATYSDHVLLDRKTLVERLKSGKLFWTGQRKIYLASTFDTALPVRLAQQDRKEVVIAGDPAAVHSASPSHDLLQGVPVI